MMRTLVSFVVLLDVLLTMRTEAIVAADPAPQNVSRWEADVARFETQDRERKPAKNGIVLAGSSSIRLWNVEKSFPNRPVLNRGFGGSNYSELAALVDRVIVPYEPRIVVLYSGDNDIAQGKSPERVAADHREVVRKVREKLPETQIVTIAIKPSVQRWKLVDKMRAANQLMKQDAAGDPGQVFLDIDPAMIGADGQPRAELFQADGLHLNDAGYKIWTALLEPHLKLAP